MSKGVSYKLFSCLLDKLKLNGKLYNVSSKGAISKLCTVHVCMFTIILLSLEKSYLLLTLYVLYVFMYCIHSEFEDCVSIHHGSVLFLKTSRCVKGYCICILYALYMLHACTVCKVWKTRYN